ncbi:Proton myo-inositol cotransporter [Fasciolopsis buskii]|uniref:Proton myo-inositol cotransporter n=1 Tax=Fasciolopsis buskii TaxID=27845 RepID=A0A8E0RPV8_9TREM|nr:Proton myo-inositol cotransporter [Fasciolopsis buski]
MAPLPWTIISEMFPTWARSTGMAGGATSNWLANIFVSLTFLTLTEHLTRQGTYFLYAGITVLALAFVYNCVPETGTGALEDLLIDDAQQPVVVTG